MFSKPTEPNNHRNFGAKGYLGSYRGRKTRIGKISLLRKSFDLAIPEGFGNGLAMGERDPSFHTTRLLAGTKLDSSPLIACPLATPSMASHKRKRQCPEPEPHLGGETSPESRPKKRDPDKAHISRDKHMPAPLLPPLSSPYRYRSAGPHLTYQTKHMQAAYPSRLAVHVGMRDGRSRISSSCKGFLGYSIELD
jgi:hypothetical protein